jgi:hypothetical protein
VGTVVIVAMVSGLMTFGGLFLLAMDPSQKITIADMIVVSVDCAVVVLSVGLAIVVVFGDRMFVRGRCLQCGYALEGLTGDRCPECGERLEEVRRVMGDTK